MEDSIYNQLLETNILPQNIFLNESMSKHTSFKAGGKAKYFIKIYSTDELKNILKLVNEQRIKFFILGNGTNVLFRDEDFDGIVLQIKMNNIEINKTEVIVDAGVKNAILSNKLIDNNLSGFEFASGIPGTIGGAIKMNVGAYGKEMKDIVEEVTCMDYSGNIITLTKDDCNFAYRDSLFEREKLIILNTKLKLEISNKDIIEKEVKELAEQRKLKQPLEYPSAGSTFKRGRDFITAKLIDDCGLKGYQIGGAQVSEKHARIYNK